MIFEKPFDPKYAANEIVMTAMGNTGCILVFPGDSTEYQDGAGQTQEGTMWRQVYIVTAIYHDAALFPPECLSPNYFLRAVGDVIEDSLYRWNPFNFPVAAMMLPKLKGRFVNAAIIDGDERQMNVLTMDFRVPVNINIRNKP